MKEIGSFFWTWAWKKEEYHKDAIKLNTGRNALEYILRAKKYNKVYIPFYICSSVLEPINKLGLEYEYYHIDKEFNIELELSKIESNNLLLYVNYFGICNNQVEQLLNKRHNYRFDICIDNTQAFFNRPKGEEYTIYSARKFFGVPEGAYLYTNKNLRNDFNKEIAYDKSNYLLKRIDLSASDAYSNFKESSKLHSNQDIKLMSNLSQRISESIDYDNVIEIRKENFKYLNEKLNKYNRLDIDEKNIICPMVIHYL